MKKLLSVVLVFVLCLALLSACGAENATEEKQESITAPVLEDVEKPDGNISSMVNPNETVTKEELAARTGLSLDAPEGAENAVWQVVNGGEKGTIAELDFTLDGAEYCYRAQSTAIFETYDMSGMFYNWTATEDGSVGGRDAKVFTCDEAGYVSWLDIVPGINYNLSSTDVSDSGKLLEVANLVFVEAQGDVDGDGFAAIDYAGLFKDGDGTEYDNDVTFTEKGEGEYDVVIGIIRLAQLEGTATRMDDALELELTDPSGNPMSAVFYPAEDGTYTLKITDSTWTYLETDYEFAGFTKIEG